MIANITYLARKRTFTHTRLFIISLYLHVQEQLIKLEKWINERTGIDYIFHVKLAQTRDTMDLKILKIEDAK